MKDFTDKVVVVTGAGSGMGRSYALELARRGATLALNDYDEVGLKETASLIPAATRMITETYDVSNREATYAFAERVRAELGNAHTVINNAGVAGGSQPVWALTDADYERNLAINFWGVLHGTRAFLPQVVANKGAIVNISSIFGLVGTPSSSDYNAAKFAVRGFTEALSSELLGTGVSVHLVHPGGIATNISNVEGGADFGAKFLTTSPDDIARVVLDAIGTRRTRIVYGNGAAKAWFGARFLPQRVMAGLVRRDIWPVLDQANYPAPSADDA